GVLHNALSNESFLRAWTGLMAGGVRLRTPSGSMDPVRFPDAEPARVPGSADLPVGKRVQLKWYPLVQEGTNPEIEVARFLCCRQPPAPVRTCAGYWEYLRKGHFPLMLALLEEAVPARQNAWVAALDELGRYFETVRALPSV